MGQQPRFPNQAVKVKIGIVGRPDLDVHRVLCRRGDGFRRPVIDGVKDHAAVGRFLADGLRRRVEQQALRRRAFADDLNARYGQGPSRPNVIEGEYERRDDSRN